MKTLIFALTFVVLSSGVSTVFAQDAQKLSKEELEQVIPGSKVSSTSPMGNYHRWVNDPSGEFLAEWEMPSGAGAKLRKGASPGKWRISDDGKYCVRIEWPNLQTEAWCADVQKSGDGKYTLITGSSPHQPPQLEISK